jgi:hypothetical protein
MLSSLVTKALSYFLHQHNPTRDVEKHRRFNPTKLNEISGIWTFGHLNLEQRLKLSSACNHVVPSVPNNVRYNSSSSADFETIARLLLSPLRHVGLNISV